MSQSQATYIESHILRRFNIVKKVGSGAYGHVWKVEEKSTKRIFALKKIFDAFQHATDAQRTFRQIQILRQTEHPNIIRLFETICADNNKDVYLLFEFMEADLHNVISEGILKDVHIRFIIYQLAKALKYLHSGSIIHRDLKPSNILVNSNCTIKLCDFGLVRSLSHNAQSNAVLTQGVATRWYRAPQVLLGSKSYSTPADIWSFGCIVFQILAQKPLFAGNSTLDQIQKICTFTGMPSEEDVASLESQVAKSMVKEVKSITIGKPSAFLKDLPLGFADLLERILVFNPKKRITIEEILGHQVVKAFHKPEEETGCQKVISTSIDDNKKFTVDEYRKLIYGNSPHNPPSKPKALSASLGSGSTSLKYLPSKQSLNGSTGPSQSTKPSQKPEITKKYSYQKFRAVNLSGQQISKEQQLAAEHRKFEKQTLKYVRSAKQFNKPELLPYQQYKKTSHYDSHNKEEENSMQVSKGGQMQKVNERGNLQSHKNNLQSQKSMIQKNNYEINKGISHSGYISKTFYTPKNTMEVKAPSANNILAGQGWRSPKFAGSTSTTTVLSAKEIKDKGAIFKSPKYISGVIGFGRKDGSGKPQI